MELIHFPFPTTQGNNIHPHTHLNHNSRPRRQKGKSLSLVATSYTRSEQPTHEPTVESLRALLPLRPLRLLGQILLLLLINDILAGIEIRILRRPALTLLDKFVPEDHSQIERDSQITRNEALVIEVLQTGVAALDMHKGVKVLEDGDHDAEGQSEVCPIQAKRRGVGHLRVGDALGAPRFDEIDVCDEDGYPGQKAEDGDEVDEVTEDFCGIVAYVQEGDEGDGGREGERVNG